MHDACATAHQSMPPHRSLSPWFSSVRGATTSCFLEGGALEPLSIGKKDVFLGHVWEMFGGSFSP